MFYSYITLFFLLIRFLFYYIYTCKYTIFFPFYQTTVAIWWIICKEKLFFSTFVFS